MKQWLTVAGFSFMVIFIGLGCGTSNQLAAGIIYDARAQVSTAKAVDAQSVANQQLVDAEEMLSQAEVALNNGKAEEAYRLGMRAYLKAKVVEAVALANKIEAQGRKVEEEWDLKLQAVEGARHELEGAELELEQLKSTPEE